MVVKLRSDVVVGAAVAVVVRLLVVIRPGCFEIVVGFVVESGSVDIVDTLVAMAPGSFEVVEGLVSAFGVSGLINARSSNSHHVPVLDMIAEYRYSC